MNLNELNYILCIAKYQNLTKAAQELYLSQPTLSKALQRAERELDIKLFDRIDNRYIPTQIGRHYLIYAEQMLGMQSDWEKELKDLKEETTGELNIAIPLMRSSCLAPQVLPLFHQTHPRIKVNFMEETYAVQEKLLLDNCVDFAIFNESAPHPKLIYETIGEEEILLVISADHPLSSAGESIVGRKYPFLEIEKLKDEKFILLFPEQTTGKIARNFLQAHCLQPEVLFQTRNTQAAISLAAKGLGVCFAPETYVKQMTFQSPLACFSIETEGIYSPLIAAFKKGVYLPGYAKDFINFAKSGTV